jgi:predicted nucleic-acid-binding Zn-ribbon protein
MEQEENQQEIKFCIKCSKSEIPEDADPDVGLYGSVLTKLLSINPKTLINVQNGKCFLTDTVFRNTLGVVLLTDKDHLFHFTSSLR